MSSSTPPAPSTPAAPAARLPGTTPGATYRLQMHPGFTLDEAARLAPYLASLGVTHCYCSPIFTANPGSTHGYDVCRHAEINPELGGEAGLAAFSQALTREGLGLVLDFVPNHMSVDPHTNPWWRDVLENGPSSPFARYFDIDWDPIKPELKDRLLLPVLGEPYGEALESGAIALQYEDGGLFVTYGTLRLPVNPRRSTVVYDTNLEALATTVADSDDLREFQSILTSLRNLPPYTERDARRIEERQREKEVARQRLVRLAEANPSVRTHIDQAVAAFNGRAGDPASFDRLHHLLEQQAYRLASWRTASDEINYRRFFDINDLAGLRVEDPVVFDQIHSRLLDLLATGTATGVRLDHIDGLFDPQAYLEHLAERAGQVLDATGSPARPYIVVEKILAVDERLREDWPVAGTTGYDFMNEVNGVLVDTRNARTMRRVYERVIGRQVSFPDVAYESQRLAVSTALGSEFQVLAQAVNRLSERDRRSRDFTLGSIRRALREVVACFPIYRTYVDGTRATPADVNAVDAAIADAKRRNPAMETSIFAFLRTVLLPPPDADQTRRRVAQRFQQYTAPVQAKGVEDTAFYRYHALASLNEVGGDPAHFGRSVEHFHAANLARQQHWPGSMLATTTHDTKRSEDARVRITALSELADRWKQEVARWRRLNAPNRTRLAGGQAPDPNDEYLFYQTLLATWPIEAHAADAPAPARAPDETVARLTAYMDKALKEAKLHTSWITPNAEYEAATARFVERTLTGRTAPAFLAHVAPFAARVARAGMVNALSQLVLKLAAPGVPDFYQGTELWDLSLVDPDNRRPVDFDRRRQYLDEMAPWLDGDDAGDGLAAQVAAWLASWPDGRIKLYVTARGLRVRRRWPDLFRVGTYEALTSDGDAAEHVVAFARRHEGRVLLAVVPRLGTALVGTVLARAAQAGTVLARAAQAGTVPAGSVRAGEAAAGGVPTRDPLPTGETVWGSTTLVLPAARPADTAGQRYRNVMTGEWVSVVEGRLRLADVFAVCPVALLVADGP
ncbi:MAG: malto-oligosyltrehalose synthase [Vicinamibacterales bacterium]